MNATKRTREYAGRSAPTDRKITLAGARQRTGAGVRRSGLRPGVRGFWCQAVSGARVTDQPRACSSLVSLAVRRPVSMRLA